MDMNKEQRAALLALIEAAEIAAKCCRDALADPGEQLGFDRVARYSRAVAGLEAVVSEARRAFRII